jgi:1-acyl-sn-glycerol-3-phosphate acyltransferase
MPERTENERPETAQAERAARLMAEVRAVASELHPHLAGRPMTLDSLLDKDLGFDSLGRVELMVRIERAFGVALPEQAFAAAETPRDLLRAVAGARHAPAHAQAGPQVRAAAAPVVAGGLATALTATTLIEMLDLHVHAHPDLPHVRFYSDEGEGETITFRQLRDGAEKIARGLHQGDFLPGRAVLIMLPTGPGYFFSFFGVLLAGGVPVPIYPPARPGQIEDHLNRHAGIAANAQATTLITVGEAKRFAALLKARTETLGEVVTVEELMGRGGAFTPPPVKAGDIAFLQYTSGSTGNPKGVVLTHANLLANIRAMGEALEVGADDVFVSWLPLYHDMGLIGAWLGNMHYAVPLVIMSPLSFLSRPQRWLWAIHRHRGTFSAAPNFAYELCLRRVADKDIEGLDLGSWRRALNGAEAINPDTLRRFQDRFGAYGFGPEAMKPVYGLAESSVGLAFPPMARGPLTDVVDRETFALTGVAEPRDPGGADTVEFVACGRPLTGHQIRIVDGDGRELPERREGRLQFRGPSATAGYFRNPQATAALFDGDWLNSGDLAYIAGGDVFITGRTKDLIIRAGRNIYPAEFEDAVGDLDGVRKGNVAVFGTADAAAGTERLVVLAETRKRRPEDLDRLRDEINALAVDLIGGPPDDVLLAPPRTVLKTSSGKIRRHACRELYERGLLGKGERAVAWQVIRIFLAAAGPQWRRLARRVGGALFAAYAWGVFLTLMPTLWLLAMVVPTLRLRWAIFHGAARLALALTGTRFTVAGTENLPRPGTPAVFVSNHASYLDFMVMGAALPRPVGFVGKAELRGAFATRVVLDRMGTEYVERFDRQRGLADARRISQRLRDGMWPLFFAEGTLTRMPGLLPFHMGAFVTAVEAAVPVVPIAIRGTRSMLRDGSWFPRPGAITVTVCKPLEPEAGPAGDAWRRAVGLRDRTRQAILANTGEPDLGREDLPMVQPEKPAKG